MVSYFETKFLRYITCNITYVYKLFHIFLTQRSETLHPRLITEYLLFRMSCQDEREWERTKKQCWLGCGARRAELNNTLGSWKSGVGRAGRGWWSVWGPPALDSMGLVLGCCPHQGHPGPPPPQHDASSTVHIAALSILPNGFSSSG
jgi:hypothetical protein